MKKGTKKKRAFIIGITLLTLLILQTLPVFFVKPLASEKISNEAITVHYQKADKKGAEEVFALLSSEAANIRTKMDFEEKGPTDVYVYHTQKQLAIREAGFATLLIAPKWHIGDSHKGNVMIVSPYADVSVHTHDSILQASLHEYAHSINYKVNPGMSYFWDNGIATYLAGQAPDAEALQSMEVPTLEQMKTNNGLTFANMGGYAFSYNYIEYLDQTYGWGRVIEFARGEGTHLRVFGESEEKIHEDWSKYCKQSNIL